MICEGCFQFRRCSYRPDEDGRCHSYLKSSTVQISESVSVDPMDALTFDYDDMKTLLKKTAAGSHPSLAFAH